MEEKKIWNIYVKPKYKKSKKKAFNIKDYKSINSLNIELNKMTILVGENASGKSNILKYFNENSISFFDLDDVIKEMVKKFHSHSIGTIDGFRSSNDEIVIKPLGINKLRLSLTLDENKEIFKYTTPYANTKELPLEKTLKIGKYLEENKTSYNTTLKYFQNNLPSKYNYRNNKRIDEISFFIISMNMSNLPHSNVETLISEKLLNLLEIGFDIKNEQDNIFEVLSMIPAVNNNINTILYENIELKKYDKINNKDKKISVYLNLDVETKSNGKTSANGFKILIRDEAENTVFPTQLKSSGINNIITIITISEFLRYLIINYPKKDYHKLNFLFLLDEPELYLHPKIQKNLITYLYELSNQVDGIYLLIATHSSYIIHKNTIDSTYVINYEVNEGTTAVKLIDMIDSEAKNYNIFAPIEDSLGLSFNEFLHPIIFVEGKEELDIFKRIKEVYKYTNSIHSLNGKNKFASIAILLEKFKKKNNNFFVFLDADFNFNIDFKFVEKGKELLTKLSHNIFFIGKEIYTFDEYEKTKKDECLEDFIIFNIFDDTEYKILCIIINEVWEKYFNFDISHIFNDIKNFTSVIQCIRSILKENKEITTQYIDEKIIISDEIKYVRFKDVTTFVESKIKENIKEYLIANDKYSKFETKIIEIISK